MANEEFAVKTIDLKGDRRLINRCKKAGLECFNPKGEWTRYGYERIRMHVKIASDEDDADGRLNRPAKT